MFYPESSIPLYHFSDNKNFQQILTHKFEFTRRLLRCFAYDVSAVVNEYLTFLTVLIFLVLSVGLISSDYNYHA